MTPPLSNTKALAHISQQIKALEKKSIQNVVEIGRLLHEAEQQCDHGKYMKWLKCEFGWSHQTSLNYRGVYDLSQNPKISDFEKLDISITALYRVADRINDETSWAQTACEAILEAAKSRRVTYRAALDIFVEHKDEAFALPPKPDKKSSGTPLSIPKGKLWSTVKGMLAIKEHDPAWKDIIDMIGVDQLHRIITTLRAIHDNYNGTSKISAIKVQADRAEEKSRRPYVQ
jgi:Protein of unknown function (DUF3102)